VIAAGDPACTTGLAARIYNRRMADALDEGFSQPLTADQVTMLKAQCYNVAQALLDEVDEFKWSIAQTDATTGILPSGFTAKGDLLTATGPGAPTNLPRGPDDQVLTTDSVQPTGLVWRTPQLTSPRVNTVYGPSVAINAAAGSSFIVTPTNAVAFNIAAPTGNPKLGRRLTLEVVNNTALALGAMTLDPVYRLLTPWIQPLAGSYASITFEYDGVSLWYELGRASADLSTNNLRLNGGTVQQNGVNAPLTYRSQITDGATAIAHKLSNATALNTTGAKIVSFFSDDLFTERAFIDKDGNLSVGSTGQGLVYAGTVAPKSGAATLRGSAADASNAVALILDNSPNLAAAGSKLLSVRNATVEKAYLDSVGSAFVENVWRFAASSLGLAGRIANVGTSIGVKIGNQVNLTAIGSKIVSFYSDQWLTEKAYIDKDGVGVFGGVQVNAGGAAGAGNQALASAAYIQSRGVNLVTNGSGLLANNYNFSTFVFDSANTYGGRGSFQDSVFNTVRQSDELIPIDPSRTYRLSLWANSVVHAVGSHEYFGVSCYDIDGLLMSPQYFMRFVGSETTLANPLNPGDTTITLTSAANWQGPAAAVGSRQMSWYPYTNSFGYAYPNYTYTRKTTFVADGNYNVNGLWATGGITGNVITLTAPWPATLGSLPAGTPVANGANGGTYKYIAAANVDVPNVWTQYTGQIGGIDTLAANGTNTFPPGAAYVRILFLNNRDVAGNTINVSFITFNEVESNLIGSAADNVTAVANKVGNVNALTTSGGKIISFYSDNLFAEKAYLDIFGAFKAAAYDAFFANSSAQFRGNINDGASAIANKVGNFNSLVTSGAKIVSFYSDNLVTEQASIDRVGNLAIKGVFTSSGSTAATLKGQAPDATSAINAIVDTNVLYTGGTSARLLDVRNNGTSKAGIDPNGNFITSATIYSAALVGASTNPLRAYSQLPDAATAVAFRVGNANALNTVGAKILSLFSDNFVNEKVFFDKDGKGSFNGGISPGTPALAAQAGRIFQGAGAPVNTQGADGDFYFRTDTPGTAGQRIYIRAAGVWTALAS
jgi:hypothetical protein